MRIRTIPMLLCLLPCCSVAQSATLRLNPPAGRTYNYSMVNKTNQVMGSMDMSNTMSSSMSMKVLSNSGGKVLIETKISNVKMTGKNPAIAAQSAQLKKMIEGAKVKVTMNSFGTPVASSSDIGNPMLRQMMSNM